MFSCLSIIFVGCLIQISSGNENINMSSISPISTKSGKLSNFVLTLTRRVEEQKNYYAERSLRIPESRRGKEKKNKISRQRRKRSIGSVKVRGFLKPNDDDSSHSAPPSLVALVFLDILAGIFTFNAIAALLFVANSWNKLNFYNQVCVCQGSRIQTFYLRPWDIWASLCV